MHMLEKMHTHKGITTQRIYSKYSG